MNISTVTSLLPNYLSPSNSTASTPSIASPASSVLQQADVLGLSPPAQFLNQLQQLQTQSPQQFQAVISQITGQLEQAATTASGNGNTAHANQLTQLANTFQSAASGGPVPTAQQLQQAGLTGHHLGLRLSQSNGVNPYQAAASAYSQNQNQSLAASLFGSVTPTQSAWA
jgi:hypothetical protein